MKNLEEFHDLIAEFIDRHALLPAGRTIVVGVSGGADSVAMLSALRAISDAGGRAWRLVAAHLNHCLRTDADADEEFVRVLAKKLGAEFTGEKVDVRSLAEKLGIGIEEAARHARYDFFARTAVKLHADRIAVAHHADDNVETILHRIFRGTGLRGLAGIPVNRPVENSPAVLVRPMLAATRSQIEEYCNLAGLQWRTDSTNADTDITRNFIRHELLPLVRDRINPRADLSLLRLAESARLAEDYLGPVADDLLKRACRARDGVHVVLDAELLDANAQILRARVIRQSIESLGAPMRDLSAEHFDELETLFSSGAGQRSLETGMAVNLPGGFIVRRRGGAITISAEKQIDAAESFEVALPVPGTAKLPDGRCIRCELLPLDPDAFRTHTVNHRPGVEMLDAEKIAGQLICRTRRDGDSFVPLGGPGTRTVSDFLTDLKLGQAARRNVACICDSKGIVYLASLRIADRLKISSSTKTILRIEIE